MGMMYWFRLGMMVITLVAVVWIMRYLSANKQEGFTLCPTRVTLVETLSDGIKVEEASGGRWFRVRADIRQELDPIAVEKWFSGLCSISYEATNAGDGFQPALRLSYVSGQTQEILRSSTGEFQASGRGFTSKDLEAALRAFVVLPEAKPPGSH